MGRRPQFVLFMQISTFSTYKTKPNLQVKAKKTVSITSKLFNIFFFGQGSVVTFLTLTLGKTVKLNIFSFESYNF